MGPTTSAAGALGKAGTVLQAPSTAGCQGLWVCTVRRQFWRLPETAAFTSRATLSSSDSVLTGPESPAFVGASPPEVAESTGAEPDDWFTLGWGASSVIHGLLQEAADNDELSRSGLYESVDSLPGVDTRGMFPEGAGDYSGELNENASRESIINRVEEGSPTGFVLEEEWCVGPTAADFEYTEACYLM